MKNFAISVAGVVAGGLIGGIVGILIPAGLAVWTIHSYNDPSAGAFAPSLAVITVPLFLVLGGTMGLERAERRWNRPHDERKKMAN